MKNRWGYISTAAFLTIARLIGFLTLHILFFYIIPIILALFVGIWVMRWFSDWLRRR